MDCARFGAAYLPETRSAVPETESGDYTVRIVTGLERAAHGEIANPDALALAEACAGLWERAISSATVQPDSIALRSVSPSVLALAGRALAATGNAIFGIMVDTDGVTLIPASQWSIAGDAPESEWRYRLDFAGPSGSRTAELPSSAVVHCRIGVSAGEPWRGQSPLRRANVSARLAAAIESSFRREMALPVSRLVPVSGTAAPVQIGSYASNVVAGGVVVAGAGGTDTRGSALAPGRVGPQPDTVSEALRSSLGTEVAAAMGVPPPLLAANSDGTAQRESWRRFWLGTVSPIGRIIEAELRRKLDDGVSVSFDALAAADEDGRSRAVARRAAAAATIAKMLSEDAARADRAMRLAGIE